LVIAREKYPCKAKFGLCKGNLSACKGENTLARAKLGPCKKKITLARQN